MTVCRFVLVSCAPHPHARHLAVFLLPSCPPTTVPSPCRHPVEFVVIHACKVETHPRYTFLEVFHRILIHPLHPSRFCPVLPCVSSTLRSISCRRAFHCRLLFHTPTASAVIFPITPTP